MAEQKRITMIQESRFKLAQYDRQDWVVNCEYGTTTEDILDPGYWALVAKLMKPYDHIEARAEDGSWIVYLVVTGCDRAWARVAVDRTLKLTTPDVAQTQTVKHRVEWKGPQYKYSVIRVADSEKLRDGFVSKDEAYVWLREHERVVA